MNRRHSIVVIAIISLLTSSASVAFAQDDDSIDLDTAEDAAVVEPDEAVSVDPDDVDALDPDEEDAVDPDEANRLDPDESPAVDPDTDMDVTVDPDSVDGIDTDDVNALDPDETAVVDPDDGQTIDPDAAEPIDPESGSAIEPEEGLVVDPDNPNRNVEPDDLRERVAVELQQARQRAADFETAIDDVREQVEQLQPGQEVTPTRARLEQFSRDVGELRDRFSSIQRGFRSLGRGGDADNASRVVDALDILENRLERLGLTLENDGQRAEAANALRLSLDTLRERRRALPTLGTGIGANINTGTN